MNFETNSKMCWIRSCLCLIIRCIYAECTRSKSIILDSEIQHHHKDTHTCTLPTDTRCTKAMWTLNRFPHDFDFGQNECVRRRWCVILECILSSKLARLIWVLRLYNCRGIQVRMGFDEKTTRKRDVCDDSRRNNKKQTYPMPQWLTTLKPSWIAQLQTDPLICTRLGTLSHVNVIELVILYSMH